MNKRKLQKEQTRSKILEIAKDIFIKNGFLNTATEDISKKAELAHGTIFLHFNNKATLILEIIDNEMKLINDKLHELFQNVANLDEILKKYLDFIESEEDFFHIIAKEFPFYPEKLQHQIIFRESIIRNYFFDSMENGIKKGVFKKVDSTHALNFLFGTINYYLVNRSIFTESKSIMSEKKNHISKIFLSFIARENS
jgi:AcrR family transcriptional regulator